jgi:hypothetical protein
MGGGIRHEKLVQTLTFTSFTAKAVRTVSLPLFDRQLIHSISTPIAIRFFAVIDNVLRDTDW